MSSSALDVQHLKLVRPSARSGARSARIVFAAPDPYLAFLAREEFPDVPVVECDLDGGLQRVTLSREDIVIVDLDVGPPVSSIPRGGVRAIVGVTSGSTSSVRVVLDDILVRPILPAELREVLQHRLGRARGPSTSRVWPTPASVLAGARVATIALAAGLELSGPQRTAFRIALLAAAVSVVGARLLSERRAERAGPFAALVEIVLVSALIGLTGGMGSAYAPLGLITVLAAGISLGALAGALAGIAVAVTGTPDLLEAFRLRTPEPIAWPAWFGLFTVVGLSGGLLVRNVAQARAGAARLAEANRVLSRLYRIARLMPSSLNIGTVAASAIAEMREATTATAGALFVGGSEGSRVAASFGVNDAGALVARDSIDPLRHMLRNGMREFSGREAPVGLMDALHGCSSLMAFPLLRDGKSVGILLAGFAHRPRTSRDRLVLQELAAETAVAIENASLFTRVRELSIDEERRRVARDLHDGVAQALTHLRLELDLMARDAGRRPPAAADLARLSRVVGNAGADVRVLIGELHSPLTTVGLAASLRTYLRDAASLGGPLVSFEAHGVERASPEVESELFRIAQEAVSNAVRHSGGDRVLVRLQSGHGCIHLAVVDDGRGLSRTDLVASNGVGLTAMRERAERIGATLSIVNATTGGVRVEVVCPSHDDERSDDESRTLDA